MLSNFFDQTILIGNLKQILTKMKPWRIWHIRINSQYNKKWNVKCIKQHVYFEGWQSSSTNVEAQYRSINRIKSNQCVRSIWFVFRPLKKIFFGSTICFGAKNKEKTFLNNLGNMVSLLWFPGQLQFLSFIHILKMPNSITTNRLIPNFCLLWSSKYILYILTMCKLTIPYYWEVCTSSNIDRGIDGAD